MTLSYKIALFLVRILILSPFIILALLLPNNATGTILEQLARLVFQPNAYEAAQTYKIR